MPRQTAAACSEATDWATDTQTADASDSAAGTRHAERSADQPADHAAGPWMHWPPPHVPTAHDMQDGNKRVRTNYRYDEETTNNTINSDILQQCTNAMEHANGKHTVKNPQLHTTSTPPHSIVRVISAGDTAPPGTADDNEHVRSRHATAGGTTVKPETWIK